MPGLGISLHVVAVVADEAYKLKVEPDVKVHGTYYRDVLLQEMPAAQLPVNC